MFWLGAVTAGVSDLRCRRVPNALNGALASAGLLGQAWRGGVGGLAYGVLGVALGFVLILAPFALRLYRGGDAKLVMALGAWLGPAGVAWTFVGGAALGGLVALGCVLGMARVDRQRIRRTLGIAARTLTLPQVEGDRDARLHVPMAVAFSAAAVVTLLWRTS